MERGRERRRGGGGCTQFVHGRSRMTIDLRIPTMPGRSTSGFHQPGRKEEGGGGKGGLGRQKYQLGSAEPPIQTSVWDRILYEYQSKQKPATIYFEGTRRHNRIGKKNRSYSIFVKRFFIRPTTFVRMIRTTVDSLAETPRCRG